MLPSNLAASLDNRDVIWGIWSSFIYLFIIFFFFFGGGGVTSNSTTHICLMIAQWHGSTGLWSELALTLHVVLASCLELLLFQGCEHLSGFLQTVWTFAFFCFFFCFFYSFVELLPTMPDDVRSYCEDQLRQSWRAMEDTLRLSDEEMVVFVMRCVEAFFAVSD